MLKRTGEQWCLVTDGQLALRHNLHWEASRKKAKLSEHFYSFYDLKKEVKKAVKHDSDFKNLEDVASCILSPSCEINWIEVEYLLLSHAQFLAIIIQLDPNIWIFITVNSN